MLRKHPGRIDILDTGLGFTIGEIWYNTESTGKDYAFQKTASGTVWLYSDSLLPSLKYVYGSYSGTLVPLARCIGGKCCWTARTSSGAITGPYLYYTAEYGWVLLPDYGQFGSESSQGATTARFCGAIPIEYRTYSNLTTSTWNGDTFFTAENPLSASSSATLPTDFSTTATFTGRGGIRNDTTPPTLTLQWYWETYQRDDTSAYTRGLDVDGPAGVYYYLDPDTGAEDDTEDRIALGLPQYEAASSEEDYGTVVRSLTTDGSNYTYTGSDISIAYDSTAGMWIIGEYQSAAGWYASEDEPSIDTPATFEFFGPQGSSLDPQPDIVVTFSEYVGGNEKLNIQMGDVARWQA